MEEECITNENLTENDLIQIINTNQITNDNSDEDEIIDDNKLILPDEKSHMQKCYLCFE